VVKNKRKIKRLSLISVSGEPP